MEAALWELTEGDASDEVEVIIRLHRPDQIPPNVRVVTQFGNIATCRLPRGAIVSIRNDETIESMKAPMLLTADDDVPLDAEMLYRSAIATDDRRPQDSHLTGKNVVVGVVDWGCDFTHPNFRHADGSTRLLALWDQSAPYQSARPNRYGYGVIHTAEEIDRALKTANPAATLGYYFYRSDPTGIGTHGTHVLDIAAGNGRAGEPLGVAPEADLVFVHLHNRSLPSQTNLGSSVAVLEAVDCMLRTAQDRPVVMNFSMGRQMGPHDGSSLVEQGFDQIVTSRPGCAIVQSTGNYFDRMAHSSGRVLPGQTLSIAFMVSEADVTPNEMEIWYSGRDVLSIAVRAPNGLITKQTGLNDHATLSVHNQVVCKLYHRAREPNNLDNNCHIYIDSGAPAGEWTVILTGIDVVDGRFNMWIERDATCPHCQSQFEDQYVVPLSTTGSICNGFRTIAVGAYDAHDPAHPLGKFSSSGPTRGGDRFKPNLIASGVRVLAAKSRSQHSNSDDPLLIRKSGTSMAAPHVVGTIALMFELAQQYGKKLTNKDTLNLLLSSTTPIDAQGNEIYRIGSGQLNMDAALDATRDFLEPLPQKTLDRFTDIGRTTMKTTFSEATLPTEWLETVESTLEERMPVHQHFDRALERIGVPKVGSLRELYLMFARPTVASLNPQFVHRFDAIAVPGGVVAHRLCPGDILLRYLPGDRYVHAAFLASDQLLLPAQATTQGWTLETMRPGYYGVVVEAGNLPHRAKQNYARRILDARGIMPPNQVVLRLRKGTIAETAEQFDDRETWDETLGIDDDNEDEAIADFYESNPPPMTPTKAPMAVPSSDPVPFAPLPPAGSYWPIITNSSRGRTVSYTAEDGTTVGQSGRRWLADRSNGRRYHLGIDLFANFGDPVVAIEDGEIVHFYPFCCGENKTTNALFVAHSNVVVNYGEVAPDSLQRTGLRVGSRVRAGQIIGYVGRNPGGSTMIHFETYIPGTRSNSRWSKDAARPSNILNPTRYLLHLQEHGLVGTPTTPGTTPPITPSRSVDRRSPAYIQWVQSSLNQINNAGLVVDGVNGSRTREAVRNFQRNRGLTADGIVGARTEAALIAAGASPPPTSGGGTPITPPITPSRSVDRRSPAYIQWVQSSLNQINNAGLVMDGVNGSRTRQAVRDFQRNRGLTVDGMVGAQTEAALIAAGASPPPTAGGTIPTPTPPTPTPPTPVTPGTATDVTPEFVTRVSSIAFRNSTEINDYFQRTTGSDFVDWFNAQMANQGSWQGKRLGERRDIATVKRRFAQIWDRLADLFGTPSINLFQFLSLIAIMINETGDLMPRREGVGRRGHPGIAYAFDVIPDVKRSYNTSSSNRTAFDLFNNPDFLAAHGSLPLNDRVRNTTDTRWRGDRYPEGFPTDPNQHTIIHEADFFKFRGRGLIQTTFRSAYKHLIEYIRDHAIAHPILEEYRRRWSGQDSDRIASQTTNADWDRLFLETDWIVPVLGVRLHNRHSGNYLNMPLDAAVLNGNDRGSIYFVGRRISGSSRYGRLFKQRVVQMLNALGNQPTP